MADFANFVKFLKKTEVLEKSELPDKRGFELPETPKNKFLPPSQPSFLNCA